MKVRIAIVAESFPPDVHSGARETFGQTLQEAAASALPVVAPAAGGPLDIVSDGVTGFLVPPGAAGPLAGAVSRLAGDAGAMGQAGREKVTGRTWPVLGDEAPGRHPPGAPEARPGRTDDTGPHQAELHEAAVTFLAAAV